MVPWRRVSGRGRVARSLTLGVEPMEARALLSTVAAPPVAQTAPNIAAFEAPLQSSSTTAAPTPSPATTTPAPTPAVAPRVIQGGQEAATDAWNGYWLVHSKNVAKLGLDFAKVAVSHDTRKVAGAYISAAFKGDGKTIAQLNKTNVVKQVGNAFSSLSSSPGVKYVGSQFSDFGKSVATQFNKLFGL